VQDVFMRVIESAKSFNHRKASFSTWIFRIACNRCIDFIRREEKIKFISIEEKIGWDDSEGEFTQEDTLVDEKVNVEETVVKASITEAVRECIGEIRNKEEKHAILLYYISGKVYREIGKILGKSTSMARNLVKSAQDKVKWCLEQKGIDSFF
jgi:RNA polymerase sigma-70 factor (ECF subfamily)